MTLPDPDTHCFDEDTGLDVWSYSKELVHDMLSTQQATIDRLTEQRDRLLEMVKAQRQRECELLHVMRNIPHDHLYTNKAMELIAEIEAGK